MRAGETDPPTTRGCCYSKPRASLTTLVALGVLVGATSACHPTPNEEEGRRRLIGHYTYSDLRKGYGTVVNPNFKSASLELRTDGTAIQICEFKDGKRYQSSGATWRFDLGGVSIDPLKDCSWVRPDERNTPGEVPTEGASLIVEWLQRPIILMDPDLNAFYEHQ